MGVWNCDTKQWQLIAIHILCSVENKNTLSKHLLKVYKGEGYV